MGTDWNLHMWCYRGDGSCERVTVRFVTAARVRRRGNVGFTAAARAKRCGSSKKNANVQSTNRILTEFPASKHDLSDHSIRQFTIPFPFKLIGITHANW